MFWNLHATLLEGDSHYRYERGRIRGQTNNVHVRSPLRVFIKFRSYNRTLSNEQKLSVSSCLSSITHPNSEKQLTSSNVSNTVTCKEQENAIVPLQTSAEMLSVDFLNSPSINSLRSSEFLSKSVFNNCVFNFK